MGSSSYRLACLMLGGTEKQAVHSPAPRISHIQVARLDTGGTVHGSRGAVTPGWGDTAHFYRQLSSGFLDYATIVHVSGNILTWIAPFGKVLTTLST